MRLNTGKVVLIIMDGWGEGAASTNNAIAVADTPFIDQLYTNFPHSQLLTSGENVGLPDGQMGNSEVGHLNIGAGRVVYQELALINKAVRERTIDHNPVLLDTFNYCRTQSKDLHLIGLVSEGGVHSHSSHLVHLCKIAAEHGLSNIFIHAFTDGRDTDPKSGLGYLHDLEEKIAPGPAKIATIIGRYYAMDRDKRWERVKLAYDLMVHGKGTYMESAEMAVAQSYRDGTTDEFIQPICIVKANQPIGLIKEGDAVVSFNFRTDRCREITHVLTQSDLPEFGMQKLNLKFVTLTNYDKLFRNVGVVYEKDNLFNTLGEIISKAGRRQIRISETEKYPHVTFFFSGGRELAFEGEERIMIPSPKVATYDLQPAMSAWELTGALKHALQNDTPDFVCVNYPNADMVGHTGVFGAAVAAVETVDKCVSEVVTAGLAKGYSFLITADHGNADYMINQDGSPNTAHTTNPVPCFFISESNPGFEIENGTLADLAPTVLTLMGIQVPVEMTGRNLLKVKVPV